MCGSPTVTHEELCLLAVLLGVINSGKDNIVSRERCFLGSTDVVSNRFELTRHKVASLWANM